MSHLKPSINLLFFLKLIEWQIIVIRIFFFISVNKLKVKWHGLRKRFRTCINDERKSQKSGMSQNRVQIFPYRENMSFLSEQLPENMNQQFLREVNDQVNGPASASKRTAASALKNNCTSVSKRKANQKQKAPMDDFKASKKSESSNLSQFQEPTVPTSHKAESIAKLSLVSTNKNTEVRTLRSVQIPRFSCHPRPDSCEEDDEDFEFYRSLKTWTRHFNDDEKLQFRLEVMKIIDQIRTAKNDSNNFVVLSRMPI